jgi:TonB family protein
MALQSPPPPSQTDHSLPSASRWPLALVFYGACLAASCSHGQGLLSKADGSFQERDYESSLERYRKLTGEECAPEGSSRLCCAGLLGEAESLLALSERQAALKAFERCRQECPTLPDVRRKQFLAEHAMDPEAQDTPAPVTFTVEHVLGSLSDRAKLVWVGLFLDGEVVGREPLSVRSGSHDLEAEALLDAPGGKGVQARPVHLRARQPFHLPARGERILTPHVRLTFGERANASLPEDRTTLEMEVSGAPPVREPLPTPRPPGLGIELRVSGTDPKFPDNLAQRGSGWRVRTEICVAADGRVQSVQFVDTAPAHDPVVDATILEAVRRWRYGAYKVDGVARGFCHPHEVDLAK